MPASAEEIIVIVLLLLLLFIFIAADARNTEKFYPRFGHPGHPGHPGRHWRHPRRPPGWVPRYYGRTYPGPYDYGYYNLAYRTPVYVDVDDGADRAGIMWCGIARDEGGPCSSEETVAIAGSKDDVAQCPYGYNDNGFKEYTGSGVLGLGESTYKRICELAV